MLSTMWKGSSGGKGRGGGEEGGDGVYVHIKVMQGWAVARGGACGAAGVMLVRRGVGRSRAEKGEGVGRGYCTSTLRNRSGRAWGVAVDECRSCAIKCDAGGLRQAPWMPWTPR